MDPDKYYIVLHHKGEKHIIEVVNRRSLVEPDLVKIVMEALVNRLDGK